MFRFEISYVAQWYWVFSFLFGKEMSTVSFPAFITADCFTTVALYLEDPEMYGISFEKVNRAF